MLLRDSEYKGSLTYNDVLKLDKNNIWTDKYGYQEEFINMVEKTMGIKEKRQNR